MKLEGNKFFVVDSGSEKWIFNEEEEAIEMLKGVSKKNADPERAKILEVELEGDKWSIKQMPWSKIAMKILRGE